MKPIMLETFSCASGSGEGYRRAGFDVYAIDNDPKVLKLNPFPHLCTDAMAAIATLIEGGSLTFSDGRVLTLVDIDAIHGSPPCQGYSIMNNLPWIRSRTYPLLILPLRELLEQTGKPYIIENVAGAASVKNLTKLGLLEHRLRAAWLCGGMFGLPIYRHRYFETNFFWPMPGHPKHQRTRQPESSFSPRPRGVWEQAYEAENPGRSAQAARVNTGWRAGHDGVVAIEKRPALHLPTVRRGQTASPPMAGHSPGNAPRHPSNPNHLPAITDWTLTHGNGAQKEGVAVGHAAGWRIAAEAMGIDWMNRATLTQAIPPVMTEYIGRQLMKVLA